MAERLTWGILSTAHINRRALIPALQEAGNAYLLGIASREAHRARAWAEEFAIPRHYPSYEALLDDAEIQAVYIPLPNHLHQEWTVRAAQAAKHVLCEKPLALGAAEARAMIEAAEAAGVVLMEAVMYRFHPQTERALEIVRTGELGELKLIRSSFSFALDDPHNIRLRPETGGGALLDVGCYAVNACRTFFGQEPWRVQATARYRYGVDVSLSGFLDFPSGGQGLIDCSFERPLRHTYEVIGTRGRLVVPAAFDIRLDPGAVHVYHPAGRAERVEVIPFESTDHYRLMVEHFGRAVLDCEPLRYPASEGETNIRVLEALARAAREGVPQTLERVKDAAASRG